MKLASLFASSLVASLSAFATATISFHPLPLRLYTGNTHELHWSSDRTYTSELLLVEHFDKDGLSGWNPVATIFQDRQMSKGSDAYNWTVPSVRKHDVSYSLWLSGSESPSTGYANLTNRFHIEKGEVGEGPAIYVAQLAGIIAGCLASMMLFAGASFALLRLMRRRHDARHVREDAFRDWSLGYDVHSVFDEKSGLKTNAMKERF